MLERACGGGTKLAHDQSVINRRNFIFPHSHSAYPPCAVAQHWTDDHAHFRRRIAGGGCRDYLAYIAVGTRIPMIAKALISSRRTTAAVVKRNLFRASSVSLRMGWR